MLDTIYVTPGALIHCPLLRNHGAKPSDDRLRRKNRKGGVWVCPLPSRIRSLGERRELPKWGPGRLTPAENTFWCIIKATERSFMDLYADALSSFMSHWGKGRGLGATVPCPIVERCVIDGTLTVVYLEEVATMKISPHYTKVSILWLAIC